MAKNSKWQDDYWLLLMQIYLQKPVGVKPMYSRGMIDLCMELHIAPNLLFNKMCELANLDTPRIEHLWETYGNNPRFEKDFKPVAEGLTLTPVMLILILDLYFRLTPITMVKDTPEVQELARLIKVSAPEVVEVLETFQYCDPYLKRKGEPAAHLIEPCKQVWRRYGNADTEELVSFASQLKEYFK